MKKIFLSLSVLLFALNSYSSHIIGGEVSYECLGNNLYQFKVKIYRDCYNGVPPLDAPAYFTVFNASNQVIWNDTVSLLVDTLIPLQSQSTCLMIPTNVCVEEGTYIFTVTLPPSTGGYAVAYQRCCRNGTIVNLITPGGQGSTYFAELNDAVLNLCNNSATFKNYPAIYLCAGEPLVYDHSAVDVDGDSLAYSLMRPYKGAEVNTQPVTASPPPYLGVDYLNSYSETNPMDGNPGLAIDPSTGILTITPTGLGQYAVGVCVREYRNGVFLGEHFRDFQFNVVDCNSMAGFLNNVVDLTRSYGQTANYGVTPSNANESLQWQENTGGGFNNILDGGQYSGTTTSILTISNVTLSQNGNTYRCYAFTDSCSDTTNAGLLSVFPLGTTELMNSYEVSLSPNPSTGLFSVELNVADVFSNLKIENTLGQIVFEQLINNEKTLSVELTGVTAGIYFIRFAGEQALIEKRVVIK
ncbi:MAG: T9SS type A sorting domain-containing protein [Bacteroidota bacterium]